MTRSRRCGRCSNGSPRTSTPSVTLKSSRPTNGLQGKHNDCSHLGSVKNDLCHHPKSSCLVAKLECAANAMVDSISSCSFVDRRVRHRGGASRMADATDHSFGALSSWQCVRHIGADLDRSTSRKSRAAIHHRKPHRRRRNDRRSCGGPLGAQRLHPILRRNDLFEPCIQPADPILG